jgi:hypothetical protein
MNRVHRVFCTDMQTKNLDIAAASAEPHGATRWTF